MPLQRVRKAVSAPIRAVNRITPNQINTPIRWNIRIPQCSDRITRLPSLKLRDGSRWIVSELAKDRPVRPGFLAGALRIRRKMLVDSLFDVIDRQAQRIEAVPEFLV